MIHMRYGIICAMESEIRILQEDIQATNTTVIAGRSFIEGTLYGNETVLVQSLIGKVASALTTTLLIHQFKVDCVIFCGTAGGIDKSLNVGDVVIGDSAVQHDVMVDGELFTIPRINIGYFKCNEELSKRMYNAVSSYLENDMKTDIPKEHLDEFNITSPKVVTGTIASGDQFICDGSKNAWLEENVENVKCVEMEGAPVAQVCYEFNVPFAIMRVISDCAGDDASVDYYAFVSEAASHFTGGSMKAFLQSNLNNNR